MKCLNNPGFTVIEIILFLGISGLLVFGILAGTGTSINIQRYRDSVSSFQSVLQKQFSEVTNTINNRDSSLTCGGATSATPRGQSDCVILGRLVTSSDGTTLTIRSVIGNIPLTTETDDIKLLQAYNMRFSPIQPETYTIEWGASAVKPGNNNIMAFSVLIVSLPSNGVIRTFIDDTQAINNNDIANIISGNPPVALSRSAKICINSNGLYTGTRMAIMINKYASNSSSIETLGENSGC